MLAASYAIAGEAKAPDWALQAAQLAVPAVDPEVSAYVLLRQDTLTVDKSGRAILYHREVRKILRPQGKPLAVIDVSFDSHSKVEFLHVWTLEPDGHEYAVKNRDIADVGDKEAGMLYVDDRAKIATAIGADTGSVVAFEYQQKLQPYLTSDEFDLQENDLPVLQQDITLQLPHDAEYYAAWAHHAVVAPVQVGDNEWQWEIPPLPAVKREPLAPARRAMHSRMLVSYFSSELPAQAGEWKLVGRWFEQLSADRDEVTPEMAAEVATLTRGSTDFMGKLLAITGFMQDQIRYIGIELGIGGWQPHAAGAVFQNRYGDCKDKATLLIAMLHAAGIQAHYLIVDSDRGYIVPAFPSQFADHMITAIELPKGLQDARLQSVVTTKDGRRLLIFDPTERYLPAGQLEDELQGSYGLLVDGPNTQLLHLPVVDPAASELKMTGNFQLTADGALTGTLEEDFSGPKASSARYLFDSGDVRRERIAVQDDLRDGQAGIRLESFQVKHASDRNQDLILQCKLSSSSYAKKVGTFLLVRPRVVGTDIAEMDLEKPRKYAVQFPGVDTQTEDYTMNIPAGYTVEDVPDPMKLDAGFATYASKTVVSGNLIHLVRALRVKQLVVPAEEYGELAKFIQQVSNDESNAVLLKKMN